MTDLELYNKAKEAYYNGEPIMEDFEFDELEKKLGLENKSYIGAKHNPSYTIKHPFIMGSLSKVQIKKSDDGSIDWQSYFDEVKRYIDRLYDNVTAIITPKYDGCSFEAVIKDNKIISISTRGDGFYGKDIYNHLIKKFDHTHTEVAWSEYILRGEVLINKFLFAEKYPDFVNPRSFVSGILNRDYDENDEELKSMLDDLSIVIYDVRAKFTERSSTWKDLDWTMLPEMHNTPEFYFTKRLDKQSFIKIYEKFSEYREKCPFALDGIVFKPMGELRYNNMTEARPKDCVAVKFIPMLEETEVVDIEWNTGKTNELRPVIIVNPVVMDGKQVTRASAHNYGYMVENKISIGTKVILSLAGDIIPFIYKITNTTAYEPVKMKAPMKDVYRDGCHLYKILTEDEKREMKFIQSAGALSIPQIGPAAAKNIYDYLVEQSKPDDFLGLEGKEVPSNILECSSADISNALGGKTGTAAMKSFETFKKGLSLSDIIVSCTFESCGRKIANAIQDKLLFGIENFEHLAEKAYTWCFDEDSNEMRELNRVLSNCGKTLDIFKQEQQYVNEAKRDQIPVILTGEPNGYTTKDEFLRQHPEYRLTGSWKEVKIVFTNSLDSNTGKMKKAREKGIEIRLY